MSVDRVGAVDERDAEPGGERPALHLVDHVGPVRRRGAGPRDAPSGVEHASDGVVDHRGAVGDGALDLRHLCRLLAERHAGEEVPDSGLDGKVRVLIGWEWLFLPRHR